MSDSFKTAVSSFKKQSPIVSTWMLLEFHVGPTQSSDRMNFREELTSARGSNIRRTKVKIKMERNPLLKLCKKMYKQAK